MWFCNYGAGGSAGELPGPTSRNSAVAACIRALAPGRAPGGPRADGGPAEKSASWRAGGVNPASGPVTADPPAGTIGGGSPSHGMESARMPGRRGGLRDCPHTPAACFVRLRSTCEDGAKARARCDPPGTVHRVRPVHPGMPAGMSRTVSTDQCGGDSPRHIYRRGLPGGRVVRFRLSRAGSHNDSAGDLTTRRERLDPAGRGRFA